MQNEMTQTFQTRLNAGAELDEILVSYAKLLSTAERALFAEVAKGHRAVSCKNNFLKKYGITARQFNGCRTGLEGKVAAYQASQELAMASLKRQIAHVDKQIQTLAKKPSKKKTLHLKKRRRQMLNDRLAMREKDSKQKRVRLCFGSNKLFRAQFHLEKNGFSSHAEWKKEWEAKRNSEFFVLGSKDETGGNQTCTARIQPDGKFALRLRLPDALAKRHGKYVEFHDVSFAYGNLQVLAALNHPTGKALSYRFKKDKKGWRVFASVSIEKAETISKEGIGAIGIDLNAGHVALIETDRFGNPVSRKVLPWVSYGKSSGQLKAITGDLCKEIVERAKKAKKPLVIEKLDFQSKKESLKGGYDKYSRLLTSFAYSLFFTFLLARAFKQGITIHQVNPAYTSVMGAVNYAIRYGLSIHLAAALCIARRYQKFSESPNSSTGTIPDGKGSHVAFALPARNRTKHVWHFWAQAKKKIPTVLAAHFRAMKYRSLDPPSSIHVTELPEIIGEIPMRESSAKLLG
jgi:IS605 OrfB family transposase